MPAPADTWVRLRELPLTIESYAFERLSAQFSYGHERVTTRIRLRGGGREGHGEDVSPHEAEDGTLHVLGPVFPLVGEWTLEAFCDHLGSIEQWPVEPPWDMMRRFRNWAFESAALDLALAQAGLPLHEALGVEPRPLRFVNSLGLGEPPRFDPIAPADRRAPRAALQARRDLGVDPGADRRGGSPRARSRSSTSRATTAWRPASCRRWWRCTSARSRRSRTALLEDAHDLPEVAALLGGAGDRISYDAPVHSVEDIDALPLAPTALNIKPCRIGDLRSLFAVYAECSARGLLMYGGGMGELDVGRDQIQLLASLFHPDGPNDTAPSGYNADVPAASLPSSPLAADPAPVGFRRLARADSAKT